jgi:RNA polymerase sigma-70 factor (ECF subfamily)
MPTSGPDTDVLLERIRQGDAGARGQLLARHRPRLKRLVALRLDRRLVGRLDPSDVVQEVLAEADRKLSDYLAKRPLPFYPWLRGLAWDELLRLHDQHVRAGKRTVLREEGPIGALPDESVLELAQRLVDPGTGPNQKVMRDELCARVRRALGQLGGGDRDVLVLRFLEQLSVREVAAVLGASEGAVKTRQVRALDRLHALLAGDHEEGQP